VNRPALLDRRALNRATLARQQLLERACLTPADLVAHLVGLQAQTPQTWYIGLWSRLGAFDPEQVSALLQQRELVRISLMRSTIHLVTAQDCLGLRALFDQVNARGLKANLKHGLAGVDTDELATLGRQLLADGPLTFSEMGDRLLQRWPDAHKSALAQGVRALVPLVQVPPRGLWGRSGPVAHTTAAAWLGRPLVAKPVAEDLVRRYLAAFGPASVLDVQTWSGLTRLGEVVERLRAELVTFVDARGRELFDHPDAPRPPAETAAPPRFLADFDNLLLGHADRSRVVTPGYLGGWNLANGQVPRSFLLDGFTAGTWTVEQTRAQWTLQVDAFTQVSRGGRAALEEEGLGLLQFLSTGVKGARSPSFAVRFVG
jgi:Winged helix DNA-binding domain